jgi:hypothetical protein
MWPGRNYGFVALESGPRDRCGHGLHIAAGAHRPGTDRVGVAYDVCYHQACDTIANPNMTALDVNADAIADSTARYAFNLSAIPPRAPSS